MGLHALLKWIEVPPKWDVVPAKDIRGPLKEGAKVEARFKDAMHPATIVQLGKYLPTYLVLPVGCNLGVLHSGIAVRLMHSEEMLSKLSTPVLSLLSTACNGTFAVKTFPFRL